MTLAGEVGDVGLIAHRLADGLECPRDVAVAEHHTFRRPGRAGGVDDRRGVVEGRRLGLGRQVGGLGGDHVAVSQDVVTRTVRVDQRDVFDGRELVAHGFEALEEAIVFEDRHRGAAVVDEILDLVGGR